MNVHIPLQADIFSLGTCLYELMSLRPLPPDPKDMSDAEYKNMLKMGKRVGFFTTVRCVIHIHIYTLYVQCKSVVPRRE